MPRGSRANSDGGNGHGDQPFTADWFIPNTTMTPPPVGLDFTDSTLLNEFNCIAQMLDWDNNDMNNLSEDFSFDHLNYGPYVEWPYPSSMPADYWNSGYLPIPEQNFSSVNENYCETIPGDGLGYYRMNLDAMINGTDANLSDKNHSNVYNSDISPGSIFDNNESVTAAKYSLNDPYNLTVDSPWSKGVAALDYVANDISRCSCMSCHEHKNGPTKDSKFLGKEPVSNLIVTMHNLSELLLQHCSSEMYEPREQDIESLEKVVDNLKSISKLHQGISIGKRSGSKNDTFSDSVSVESGSDVTTMIDKSDQAVKVLIKNLHEKEERHQQDFLFKNFSLKVGARCDNMKIEMEEGKPDNEKEVDEHSISELDGIDKLTNKVKGSHVSLPGTECNSDSEFYDDSEYEDALVSLSGTACNSDSGDEFDDDEWEEVADDDEYKVFHCIILADCFSDWEFVSNEELSGLNSSS